MAEFGVHGARVEGNRVVVIGRCYRGPLRVGDVFVQLKPVDEEGPGSALPVRLTVERMVAYRREMSEVDEGLTAELSLQGEGGDLVAAERILATDCS